MRLRNPRGSHKVRCRFKGSKVVILGKGLLDGSEMIWKKRQQESIAVGV